MQALKITLLFVIIAFTSNAQDGWFYQNPLPQNNDLKDLVIIEPNTVYAVGKGGTIIKSTDLGESWELQNSNTDKCLVSVFFLNQHKGWVVGEEGVVLHTTDGGLNWSHQESNVTSDLTNVYFINDSTGFICGLFKVLRTTDGGMQWDDINELSNYNYLLVAINFANENIGWLTGSGRKVLKTTNKGSSWELIYQGNNGNFNYVFIIDELNLWAAGYGYIGKTTDGGYTWQYPAYWNGKNYKKILFINSSVGFALADKLYKTTDGGDTWFDYLNINFNANTISFNGNFGIAVGFTGLIKKTTDTGINWLIKTRNNLPYSVKDVIFVDPYVGWCITDTRIYHSTDGGDHWLEQPTPAYNTLHSIHFIDQNNGWASGYEKIIKTTNGGIEWNDSYFLLSHHLFSIKFYNENFGLAVGDSGKVLKTSNGGSSWSLSVLDDSVSFRDIFYLTEDIIWLAGTKGLAFKSTDRGNNWIKYGVLQSSAIFTGIVFKDSNNGWISTNEGLLSTHNGGTIWLWENLPIYFYHYAKVSLYNNMLWLIGGYGNILVSSDYGLTWQKQNCHTVSILRSIYFIDSRNGWIAGDGSLILKTSNGGVTFNEEDKEKRLVPDRFSLSQNYPNPFNPTTKIKFSIPQVDSPLPGGARGGFITLKVYDVLGREVATLVNEEKPAGHYQVEFNASGLSSGIYFYQLKANNFIETKKMILLR